MVETSLFPRPHFSSFLRADDHVDPLSYYEYQRMQRMQKVARLQERRAKSHEPGYKKPPAFSSVAQPGGARDYASWSRQIFSKPESPPQQVSVPGMKTTSSEKATSSSYSLHSPSETQVRKEAEERLSVPQVSFQKCDRERRKEEGGGGQVLEKIQRARRLKSATTTRGMLHLILISWRKIIAHVFILWHSCSHTVGWFSPSFSFFPSLPPSNSLFIFHVSSSSLTPFPLSLICRHSAASFS